MSMKENMIKRIDRKGGYVIQYKDDRRKKLIINKIVIY